MVYFYLIIAFRSILKQVLLQEFHQSPLSRHVGVAKTLARLQEYFAWIGMCADVKLFVSQCPTCQHNKYETKRPVGLLQPLPIPTVM